jgi:hypothetical protein
MTKAAKTAVRPSPAASAAPSATEDGLKLQAFAAPKAARRANWELRALGVLGFELASTRG